MNNDSTRLADVGPDGDDCADVGSGNGGLG